MLISLVSIWVSEHFANALFARFSPMGAASATPTMEPSFFETHSYVLKGRSCMTVSRVESDVADLSLAADGVKRTEWAGREMGVLKLIREQFRKDKPLAGQRLAACLHVTSETANLAITLKEGGADIRLCASNPLSTQDDVAAALVAEYGIPVFAINGEDTDSYYKHLNQALDHRPTMTMDDGADLVALIHGSRLDLVPGIRGGTEETTTGVIRLRSLAQQGKLLYPIIAVNDADTKHLFDNRYGTGQSTLDGITRATNVLWAGKTVVVIGYGWCGRGVAMRARGMGAQVIVCEIDPIRGLEALMDGNRVMPLAEAAPFGDIFITLTGDIHVIGRSHLERIKDGAIIANSGHFDVEIDIPALEDLSSGEDKTPNVRRVRPFVDEYTLKDGRKLYLLGEGRLINLAAAEGHPSAVMDLSFADQALAARYVASAEGAALSKDVHVLPHDLDEDVARIKLESIGVSIDTPTAEQLAYLQSWEMGT
jgi:adenosylhomocysteinase